MHSPERQKQLPPNFMMENLFQDLYDVDDPAHWEAYSAPPSPIAGCKVSSRKAGNGGIIEKVAEGEGKGENEREREGNGKGE